MVKSSLLFLIPLLIALFSPASAEYNQEEALEYVYASGLAYCDSASVLSWSCGASCQNMTGYQVSLAQTLNIASDQSLALVLLYNPATKKFLTIFRGTVGAFELIQEVLQGNPVTFDLANITGAEVDNYFYNNYVNQLRPIVIPALQKAYESYSDYQFVFTGHSLGAAFATLAAFDMINLGIVPREQTIVYNYGSPRVGNYILAQAIQDTIPEIYRVVHWKDIVPHVPPCHSEAAKCVNATTFGNTGNSSVLWPAWHVTQEIFYNENCTSYLVCTGGEDPSCSDQFSLAQASVLEHLRYFNVPMVCGSITLTPPDFYENLMRWD